MPIVSSLAAMAVGALMTVVWPPFQRLIFGMGGLVDASGYLGTFIYGFVCACSGRSACITSSTCRFGPPRRQRSDRRTAGGRRISSPSWPTSTQQFIGTARFMSGRFITDVRPGRRLHGDVPARRRNANASAGCCGGADLFLTGITEPIEFSFLFIAPALYVVHALFDLWRSRSRTMLYHHRRRSPAVYHLCSACCRASEAAGCMCRWSGCPVLPVLLHVPFPDPALQFQNAGARGGNRAGSGDDRHRTLAAGAGGAGRQENIVELDCCATRLRVTVKQSRLLDESGLKASGARAVIVRGNGVQVIYGPHVTIIKNEVEELLDL
ncbi:PTS transporter subunit EIIC [Serratia ureilytica]